MQLSRLNLFAALLATVQFASAQNPAAQLCGQKEYQQQLNRLHPELQQKHIDQEKRLYQYRLQHASKPFITEGIMGGDTFYLPVVVHIIHNNGPENISDSLVKLGIQYLNEAYAASGYYNMALSTNTHIQFCLAKRDPDGNPTNGITRNVSPYTAMGGPNYNSDDQNVKNIVRWNPYNYINVWVVASIPGTVVGYSTLPEAHGTVYEGIIMDAAYFGSSRPNNVVLIHEIGHYLGMYHTFEGGCTNNNCMTDGDMVCDTPPSQSTAYLDCDQTMNSCTTDVQSGFTTDQNDLIQDYMDYGNFNCMKVFTQGQSDRMNWFLQNELYSLLNCKSCQPPCLNPPTAGFTASASTVQVNTTVSFTNQSIDASQFKWFVDGVYASSAKNYSTSFPVQGRHAVMLQATPDNTLCDSTFATDTITVTCGVKAGFNWPAGIIKAGQTVNFTSTATGALRYAWKVDNTVAGSQQNFAYTFTKPGIYNVMQVAYGVCTDSITQQVSVYDSLGRIPADICKPVTFQKLITTNNQLVWGMTITHDSSYILCGQYAVPFVDVDGGAYALKLSKAGGQVWASCINPFTQQQLDNIQENPDGSFIACGREYSEPTDTLYANDLLTKLDANGNAVWQKKFGLPGSQQQTAWSVTHTADGGYAFCGDTHDETFQLSDWLVVKTDQNGNVIWSKTLDNGFYEVAYSIISVGDTLVISGLRTLTTGPRSELVVTKMLAATGAVLQSGVYDIDNRSVGTSWIFKIPGGYLVGAESVADGFYYADMDQLALQLDDGLQPVRVTKVAVDVYAGTATGIHPTADGGFVTARNSTGYSNPDYTDTSWVAIAKIDGNWNLSWIKKYQLPFSDGHTVYTPRSVYPTLDGGYITGETTFKKGDYAEHFHIIKTDSAGNTAGCTVNNFTAVMETPALTYAPFTWGKVSDIVLNDPTNASDTGIVTERPVIESTQKCATAECDSLKIYGSRAICRLGDTATYSAARNAACIVFVQWQVDTTIASIVGQSDTTISLVFKQGGKTSLSAAIVTACAALQDSMTITVSNTAPTLNLGPDIQMCTSSVVKLSAGPGFKSYWWNTNSVDSTITVYVPGQYYVTVRDYCGNTQSDTVNISTAPAISLNLSAQVPRCDNDSVVLTAATGFVSYSWSPNYNISSAFGNSVTVWPAVDTSYTVVATVNAYCTVTDSTRIHVLQSLPLNIGSDTAFCTGDTLSLHAPPGFVSYLWQDGTTDTIYYATRQGVYRLDALNANGCYSRDSLAVTQLYPLPPVNLGKDGNLCLNNAVLHAGAGQRSYLWQDGSADSVFAVKSPGTYWVTVTGAHGCYSSDTVVITGFYPAPSGFLLPYESVCKNAAVLLTAVGQWASYYWSDGTALPSITVNQPGQYWLQVADFNGCAAKDTVTVSLKTDCPQVIYFPNAFTPNGDGRNDAFKPLAAAPLEQYSLIVYNRWGQKIFESKDAANGWDGTMNGLAMPPGTYVYFCRYKFYGLAGAVAKGTIVLMR